MEKKLPKGWVETELDNVGKIITGNTPSMKFPEYYGGNIPWVKPPDVNSNIIITNTEKRLSKLGAEKARILPKNSILVTCIGSLGNIAIAGVELASNQQINSVVFNEEIVIYKYGYYFLNTIKPWLIANSTSTTISMVNKANFSKAPIIFPPKAEQKRIVSKLDKLFGHLESLKTRLDTIPELIKNFRQAVLTQAVTGKLTTEDTKIENILESIIIDRKKWYTQEVEKAKRNGTKKPKKIVFEILEGKDYVKKQLVKEYDIAFIEEIAAKKQNALKAGPFGSSLKKEFYVGKGYKIYGQEQVIKNNPEYGDYYINEERFNLLKSCEINKGDILISLVGTIGKVLIIPDVFEKGIINPRLVKISLHKKVLPKYFSIFIKSKLAIDQIKKLAHGGTMDVINLGILKKIAIPLPSTEEQAEIVRRVESLFAKADNIEQQYQRLKQKIDNLPQAILAKAFNGELVEQLPTDQSAEDLLKEILALKSELGGKKKSKK